MYVEKAYNTVDSDSFIGWGIKPGSPLGAWAIMKLNKWALHVIILKLWLKKYFKNHH